MFLCPLQDSAIIATFSRVVEVRHQSFSLRKPLVSDDTNVGIAHHVPTEVVGTVILAFFSYFSNISRSLGPTDMFFLPILWKRKWQGFRWIVIFVTILPKQILFGLCQHLGLFVANIMICRLAARMATLALTTQCIRWKSPSKPCNLHRFLMGAWLSASERQQLRGCLYLCTRTTWILAAVEVAAATHISLSL